MQIVQSFHFFIFINNKVFNAFLYFSYIVFPYS